MCIAFANTKLNFEISRNGLIAAIHNSAKVWVTTTEYTLSQTAIDGEIKTICDFSNYDANNDVFCRLVVY